MNSPFLFLPAAFCSLAVIFGLACLVVGVFLPGNAQRRRRIWAKILFALGGTTLLAGLLGLWATGFSIGLMGRPPREWSDGRAPELQALIRKHCVPFMNRGKSIGLTVAVVRDTNNATSDSAAGCAQTNGGHQKAI